MCGTIGVNFLMGLWMFILESHVFNSYKGFLDSVFKYFFPVPKFPSSSLGTSIVYILFAFLSWLPSLNFLNVLFHFLVFIFFFLCHIMIFSSLFFHMLLLFLICDFLFFRSRCLTFSILLTISSVSLFFSFGFCSREVIAFFIAWRNI